MTFFSQMSAHFTVIQQLELMLRIVVAAVCGGVIGVERSRRFKDAGVRTHAMVAGAAATMMVISKYGFADLTNMMGESFAGTRGADPSRIGAQIVSGISFLGVGVIYRDRKLATRGLTTAAGIWAVAGVGMAFGAGMYAIGAFSTLFVLALQFLTHRFMLGKDKYVGANLELILEDDPCALTELMDCLSQGGITVLEQELTRQDEGLLHCQMVVRMESRAHLSTITNAIAKSPMIRSIRLNEED